jgi:hypothetical protein
MVRFFGIGRMLLAGAILAGLAFIGSCTKAPGTKEVSKLEEQRAAAESAEKKLADLRQERMKLEHDLELKQAELQKEKAGAPTPGTDTGKVQGATPAMAPAPANANQQAQPVDSTQNKPK